MAAYLEVARLKAREGNAHFEVQLLSRIHRLRLALVWFSQFLLQGGCSPSFTIIAMSPSRSIHCSVDRLTQSDGLQSHVVLMKCRGLTMAAVISRALIAEKRALNTC